MGCLTGCAAKVVLTAFNAVVAAGAGAIIILSSITSAQLGYFGDWVPKQTYQLTTALQSTGSFVLMLGILGIVTVCCCHNKIFLGVYTIIGVALVVCVLTASGIGLGKLENHRNTTLVNMQGQVEGFNSLEPAQQDTVNQYFSDGECCGYYGTEDFKTMKTLPAGCCEGFSAATPPAPSTRADPPKECTKDDAWNKGCGSVVEDTFDDLAGASYKLGVAFGLALLALLITTYILIKCTDALPI